MFTLARLSIAAAPISAAFAALAVLAPVASAAAPGAAATDALHSAPATQAAVPTMPVERDPQYPPAGEAHAGRRSRHPRYRRRDGRPGQHGRHDRRSACRARHRRHAGHRTRKRSRPHHVPSWRRQSQDPLPRPLRRSDRHALRLPRPPHHQPPCLPLPHQRQAPPRHERQVSRDLVAGLSARQTAPAVGALYYGTSQMCTATVVSPTLVLTAAHCIWANGGYVDYKQIRFAPGQSWGDSERAQLRRASAWPLGALEHVGDRRLPAR